MSPICAPADDAWWPHRGTEMQRYAPPVDWRAVHEARRLAGNAKTAATPTMASFFAFDDATMQRNP